MIFAYPFLLWFLFLTAIPLLIHLFGEKNKRNRDFSSLQFLEEIHRNELRRLTIRHWLILACRMLWIACLVFALAGPHLAGGRNLAEPGICLIDETESMLRNPAYIENVDRLESDFSHWKIIRANENNNPDSLRDDLLKRFAKLKPSFRNCVLISDFQDNEKTRHMLRAAHAAADSLYCLKIPFPSNNAALTGFRDNGFPGLTDESLTMYVRVQLSSEKMDMPPVIIMAGGKRIGRVDPDTSGNGRFTLFPESGRLRLTARIQDEDNWDNSRYYVSGFSDRKTVLFISDDMSGRQTQTALKALSAVDVVTITPNRLPEMDLNDFDLLWFNEPFLLSKSILRIVWDYAAGHSVVVSAATEGENASIWKDITGRLESLPFKGGHKRASIFLNEDIQAGFRVYRQYYSDLDSMEVIWKTESATPLFFRTKNTNFYVLLSPFHPRYNTAGLSPYFTGLVSRLLQSGGSFDRQLYTGDVLKLSGQFRVAAPDGNIYHARDSFNKTGIPGFYRVMTPFDTLNYAVNRPPSELTLSVVKDKSLNFINYPENYKSLHRYIHGVSLARIFLICVGVLFLLEILLIIAGMKALSPEIRKD